MIDLPEYKPIYDQLINRSIILLGDTHTGKSTCILDMCHALRNHIDQAIVFAPTDVQNRSYSKCFGEPVVHDKIDITFIEKIWKRQEAAASIYNIANKLETLESLFNRIFNCPNKDAESFQKSAKIAQQIKQREHEYCAKIETTTTIDRNEKIKETKKMCQDLLQKIYKKEINNYRDYLGAQNLNTSELIAIQYVNFNPRLIVIFDDCTEMINKYKNNIYLQKMFYMNRWVYITLILALHTDKSLARESKKNAFITIFTNSSSLNEYITHNKLGHEFESAARKAEQKVFASQIPGYPKLVYSRHSKTFSWYIPEEHDFKFGSNLIRKFLDLIRVDVNFIDYSNPFLTNFYSRRSS
jgi:hypothetical protein